jgi:flagellar protein FliS
MEAHDALMRAQMAVGSLRVALRREAAPELVGQLSVLYGYVIDRLIQANVRKDASELPVLRQVLEPLREAFSEAASKEAVHG